MNPFSEDNYSELDDRWVEDYEDEFAGATAQLPSMKNLNNVDYSLNSPLIADELIDFINFYNTGYKSPRWKHLPWETLKGVTNDVFTSDRIINPTGFHQWFGQFNLNNKVNPSKFSKFLGRAVLDANQTIEVLNSFIKSWLKKTMNLRHDEIKEPNILKWGTLFYETHAIVLVVNSNSREEREKLAKENGGKIEKSQGEVDLTVLNLPTFQEVKIFGSYVYIPSQRILLDRNMILMMKDTYIARFHTLMSMHYRIDNKYEADCYSRVNEVYIEGDKILAQVGDAGYEAIKLVEPTCNLRMCQLARNFRPFIPDFKEFPDHVNKSIADVKQSLNISTRLFELILESSDTEFVISVYGAFRHWGHPFIDTLGGLKKLHAQVTCAKEIEEGYANALASDLAYIVLQDQFKKTKKWYVDADLVQPSHPLYTFIHTNTWPSAHVIEQFGDNWHNLPLIKCFDIPDVIDPSVIYSDKSHSMNRSEIISHLKNNPFRAIPSKKVLQTLLTKEATNWPQFLQKVNDEGLDQESLVIGLKEKEREIKKFGRFFSLMSWDLREYFVMTEYLIKKHFVPLFYGLTMADDLTTVIKKMLETSSGQGLSDYSSITIANHVDYEKWNNHQRDKATRPVFTVMGKFLDYPNLIARTHEMFEKSWIYYPNRPDLLSVVGDQLINNSDDLVFWNGQAGGLEGLRQKGWSILNLLIIRRESAHRNTQVKCLAQGDNQVICTMYKLQKFRTDDEQIENINSIIRNNQSILDKITHGTKKLGLIINKDETMQSADYLNYGKIPIFRGNLVGLEIKRWSRLILATNDQTPNLANTMSTVSTNALTVAHYSSGPLNSMFHFNLVGNLSRLLIEEHNPALRNKVSIILKDPGKLNDLGYKVASIYLDPSLGGICGTSLTRFLIRQFPDPVSESLTFAKMVHDGTRNPDLKRIMVKFADLPPRNASELDFGRLIEDPLSLNIHKGINALTLIKNQIRTSLLRDSSKIENRILRDAISNFADEESKLNQFLMTIEPVFPRFISEFKAATFCGITENLIGMFQNSKTIRNLFKNQLLKKIDEIIIKSEVIAYNTLMKFSGPLYNEAMWQCSATKADDLRRFTWGFKIIGATVPHPAEMISGWSRIKRECHLCTHDQIFSLHISLIVPQGLINYWEARGPYSAYLGSSTSETTSIIQPWERVSNVPLIERASKLRDAIGWFIQPGSELSQSIYNNLRALTGETWESFTPGFKRTGSALHRFHCSRQSAGGYSAQSPVKLTRILTTTSTLQEIGEVNHDFMFQSCILFAQMTAGEIHDGDPSHGFYHFHITCTGCLRPIEEPTLNSSYVMNPRDVSGVLAEWKPENSSWSSQRTLTSIKQSDWSTLTDYDKSFHIGQAEGFLYGDKSETGCLKALEGSLFPLTIGKKVHPVAYTKGILEGLTKASALSSLFRWSISKLQHPLHAVIGSTMHLIDKLSNDPALHNIWRMDKFMYIFVRVSHKTPPSYPLKGSDLGELGRNYLLHLFMHFIKSLPQSANLNSDQWLFSDFNDSTHAGLLGVAPLVVSHLYKRTLSREAASQLRSIKDFIISLRSKDEEIPLDVLGQWTKNLKFTPREVRHAAKDLNPYQPREDLVAQSNWTQETVFPIQCKLINYGVSEAFIEGSIDVPQRQNPMISGLRLFQCATGAHYKIRSILAGFNISYNDAISGGDGSGGIGSMLLRYNLKSRLIFNSILELDGVDLRGTNPSPPSAISMIPHIKSRCINLNDAWQNPSDLSDYTTWEYFLSLKNRYNLMIDLIVLDMETRSSEINREIGNRLCEFVHLLCPSKCHVIFKTYVGELINTESSPLLSFCRYFQKVYVSITSVSSSQTSEVYLICQDLHTQAMTKVCPSWNDIQEFLPFVPIYQDHKSEFERAIKMKSYQMYKGVPLEYIPDPKISLIRLLISTGVMSGIAAEFVSALFEEPTHQRGLDWIIAMFVISVNSILPFSIGHKSPPLPPTDDQVLNISSLLVGLCLFIGYSTETFESYLSGLCLNQSKLTFYWQPYKQDRLWYHCTSLEVPLKTLKHLYLDNKQALIGQVIRVMSTVFPPYIVFPEQDKTDAIIHRFNTGLDIDSFGKKSGLLYHLFNPSKMSN